MNRHWKRNSSTKIEKNPDNRERERHPCFSKFASARQISSSLLSTNKSLLGQKLTDYVLGLAFFPVDGIVELSHFFHRQYAA